MFFSSLASGYCIVPLPARLLACLSRIAYRKTQVGVGRETETHRHKLFSFYLVKGMKALRTRQGELALPERALVIVLPFVLHGWTNSNGVTEDSYVYDLTPLHPPHLVN